MNISEDKAKEVLDFLASKHNCYLKQFMEVGCNEYVLALANNNYRASNFNYWWLYGVGINTSTHTTSIIRVITPQMSFADYLDKCLDITSKSYDIFICGQMFMPKNSTLEQILIDMDMNSL